MHRDSMHPPQRIFATRAIRLWPKRNVKMCMRLSPPMNSKRLPGAEKTVTRASELLLRPELFTYRPRISPEMRAWRGPFHRYPATASSSVLSNAALDSPIRADNFAQSARLRAHIARQPTFTRGAMRCA